VEWWPRGRIAAISNAADREELKKRVMRLAWIFPITKETKRISETQPSPRGPERMMHKPVFEGSVDVFVKLMAMRNPRVMGMRSG